MWEKKQRWEQRQGNQPEKGKASAAREVGQQITNLVGDVVLWVHIISLRIRERTFESNGLEVSP